MRLYLGSRAGELCEVAQEKRRVFGEFGYLGIVVVAEHLGEMFVRKLLCVLPVLGLSNVK